MFSTQDRKSKKDLHIKISCLYIIDMFLALSIQIAWVILPTKVSTYILYIQMSNNNLSDIHLLMQWNPKT